MVCYRKALYLRPFLNAISKPPRHDRHIVKPMGRNMTRCTAAIAALLGLVVGASAACAATGKTGVDHTAHPADRQAKVHGATLPPLGFLRFCGRNPLSCRAERRGAVRLHMTDERWRIAYQVNSFVNGRIEPLSDEDLYGQAEYWTYPADAGDCEDYALLKQRYLERLGFSRSALLLTVVLDEKNEGHALLTIVTDEGDFILDNRSNQIRSWDGTDYSFLKRQSQYNPRQWVSLAPAHGLSPHVTAAQEKP